MLVCVTFLADHFITNPFWIVWKKFILSKKLLASDSFDSQNEDLRRDKSFVNFLFILIFFGTND